MVHRLLKPAATSVRTPAGIILISGVLVAHAATAMGALQGWAVVYYVAALTSLYADMLAQGPWPCAPSSAAPSSATSTARSSASCPWSSSCCGWTT